MKLNLSFAEMKKLFAIAGGGIYFKDGSGISDYGHSYTYCFDSDNEITAEISEDIVLKLIQKRGIEVYGCYDPETIKELQTFLSSINR